jgi:hypothetical protein
MSDSELVLSEVSPNGNVQAIVEQDDRVAYFYLHGPRDSNFGMKARWIRNLAAAPAELDVEGLKAGILEASAYAIS